MRQRYEVTPKGGSGHAPRHEDTFVTLCRLQTVNEQCSQQAAEKCNQMLEQEYSATQSVKESMQLGILLDTDCCKY